MTSEHINARNAVEYNDNFTILDSGGDFICLEHNRSEADKYIAWFRNLHGRTVTVRENPKDVVRAAQALRNQIVRHPYRDNIING